MGSDLPSGPSSVALVRESSVPSVYRGCGRRDLPGGCILSTRQLLTLHGAFEDSTLLALHVADEMETWGMIAEERMEDEDLLKFDGIFKENAQQFRRTKTVEIMMAIDPDTVPKEAESAEDEQKAFDEPGGAPDWYLDAFDPLEPDVEEVVRAGDQPTPMEAAELITRGRAPPAWRRDDFPAAGPVRRSVWTPPYSLRSPDKEPEEWLSLNQNTKDDFRAKLKLRDPVGFATQELLRKNYLEMNMMGKVTTASVAMPLLQ